MKIYILVDLRDTDNGLDANATPFTDREAAQAALREAWEATVKDWAFDTSKPETDEHYCTCQEGTAIIHDSDNEVHWHIEEHDLGGNVAVEVGGGLVRNVFADTDLSVEVYDLDVSDFPDEGEQEKADTKEKELDALVNSPGWRRVW